MIYRRRIEDYIVGDHVTFTKTITETDTALFGAISGDFYPIHFNESLASKTRFKGRIAHGVITVGLISTVLGVPLQGPNTCCAVERGLSFRFLLPVRFGDTITAIATISEVITERRIVKLDLSCVNQRDEEVLSGTAELKVLKEVETKGD
ncbi:dehydratase [Synergistales bacterium]|nr:dehydratase [Synergistales bacterium]